MGSSDDTDGAAPSVGPGVGGSAVPVPLIRNALEAAWVVARAGLAATPPVQPPRGIRPLLHFARLPTPSLATVRGVVDGDEGFRARVAASLDEGQADRASWLWLTRPDGWEEELARMAAEAREAAHHAHEGRVERTARKRLEASEAARARAEEAADAARATAAERLEELAIERQGRRSADALVAGLQRRAEEAERLCEAARAEAAAADKRAADAEEALVASQAALAATAAERDRLVEEGRRLAAAREAAEASEAVASQHADARRALAGGAVYDAARAAQDLGAALARAAGALAGDHLASASELEPRRTAPAPVDPDDRVAAPRRPPSPARSGQRRRRRPLPVPPGLFGDSVEVAAHLVRRPHAVLLVDGYNVSLNTWPGRTLPDQRHRLVTALGELAARSGVRVHVVFDASAEDDMVAPPGESRRLVRVSFSATGEDADEVLIDLVEHTDPHRPVVVVTDDRRVRREVEDRGANAVSVAQLLGILGRRPHTP